MLKIIQRLKYLILNVKTSKMRFSYPASFNSQKEKAFLTVLKNSRSGIYPRVLDIMQEAKTEIKTKYQRIREKLGDDEAFLQIVSDAYAVYKNTTFYLNLSSDSYCAMRTRAKFEFDFLNSGRAINLGNLIAELKYYESKEVAKDQLKLVREGIETGMKKLEEIVKVP